MQSKPHYHQPISVIFLLYAKQNSQHSISHTNASTILYPQQPPQRHYTRLLKEIHMLRASRDHHNKVRQTDGWTDGHMDRLIDRQMTDNDPYVSPCFCRVLCGRMVPSEHSDRIPEPIPSSKLKSVMSNLYIEATAQADIRVCTPRRITKTVILSTSRTCLYIR